MAIVATDGVRRAGIGARYIYGISESIIARIAWRTRVVAGGNNRRRVQGASAATGCRCTHRLIDQLAARIRHIRDRDRQVTTRNRERAKRAVDRVVG